MDESDRGIYLTDKIVNPYINERSFAPWNDGYYRSHDTRPYGGSQYADTPYVNKPYNDNYYDYAERYPSHGPTSTPPMYAGTPRPDNGLRSNFTPYTPSSVPPAPSYVAASPFTETLRGYTPGPNVSFKPAPTAAGASGLSLSNSTIGMLNDSKKAMMDSIYHGRERENFAGIDSLDSIHLSKPEILFIIVIVLLLYVVYSVGENHKILELLLKNKT